MLTSYHLSVSLATDSVSARFKEELKLAGTFIIAPRDV